MIKEGNGGTERRKGHVTEMEFLRGYTYPSDDRSLQYNIVTIG